MQLSVLLWLSQSLFTPGLADQPKVRAAVESLPGRKEAMVGEWIRLTEIPSPSGEEQARAAYIRSEMTKLGLANIESDAIGNIWATRKGTEPGPPVVFAVHMDTVFARTTPIAVKRDGGTLRAPGIGDDTGAIAATLEMFRALDRAGLRTRRDLIFLATVQEETRLQGMRRWLTEREVKPAMLVAVDLSLGSVWYGAFRIARLQFFYTSPGGHTLVSRGQPNPAKAVARAITAVYDVPLPEPAPGLGQMRMPTLNVGKIGGGTVVNAIPLEAWFTVDLRSLDSATQDRLQTQVVAAARKAAEVEGVGFRMEKPDGEDLDYSAARGAEERRNHPLVRTAVDVHNFLQLGVGGPVEAVDAGSTDGNVGVAMGVPSIAVGAVRHRDGHTLREQAEEASIVTGAKMLILLAASLAGIAG